MKYEILYIICFKMYIKLKHIKYWILYKIHIILYIIDNKYEILYIQYILN